ncbi:MAG: cytochrome c-type biogenesis protein CcmH [Acidimicrobiaceae bacterium]|nr:cytochrome c-type biogenesis protein CcmH [Acidimicrobiaceae bacterium]
MKPRIASWVAAAGVALTVFLFGSIAGKPPLTNADRANVLAQRFACPVCSGQSVAESDVPVSQEIRRQIAVWVDEGRSDNYIRDQLVAAYGTAVDYVPAASGITGLVWVLPLVAGGGIAAFLTIMLRSSEPVTAQQNAARPTDDRKARLFNRRRKATTRRLSQPENRKIAAASLAGRRKATTHRRLQQTAIAQQKTIIEKTIIAEQRATITEDERTQNPELRERDLPLSLTHPITVDPRPRRRWMITTFRVLSVLLVSGVAGLLVAHFSGSRGIGDSVTGSIRVSSHELILRAQALLQEGDIAGSIAVYDEVLKLQPSNSEALTYRGWLTSRLGEVEKAVSYLDDAIGVDSEYPDARLFRAIIALDLNDSARASLELAEFDRLDPPPHAEELIIRADIRARVAEARKNTLLEVMPDDDVDDMNSESKPFKEWGFSPADAITTAEDLASQGGLLDAVKLLDWVSGSYPDDPDVLAARGWLLVRTRDAGLVEYGIEYLDEALKVDPEHHQGLVFSAFALLWGGNPTAVDKAQARDYLAVFDGLAERPADLLRLIEAEGLRELLDKPG